MAQAERSEREILGGTEQVQIETANVLLVGDRVNLFADQPGAAYGWGTVVMVNEDIVEIIRPHVCTSDFTMGDSRFGHGGTRLMSSLGWETVRLDRSHSRKLTVVFRSTVPK
jgi:hypothetical protein